MSSVPPGKPGNPRAELIARLLRGENTRITEPEALAIGDTLFNRVGLHGYPDTLEEVLTQNRGGRYQYSPMNPTSTAYQQIMEFGPTDPAWQNYINYAEKVLDERRPRTNFTHYFSGEPPVWAGQLDGLTQIGSHWFGRERRKPKRAKKENTDD